MGSFETLDNKEMNQTLETKEITVIIPAKNSSATIRDCLDAIYSNNNADFEVVVVNDGCTDETLDILSKYKCSVLRNDVHSGVSGARNAGGLASKGDVLVFIDSDIVIPSDTLSKMLEKLQNADAVSVVGMLNENIRANNFFSQYKNLWMHYTFSKLPENISLIFSSIAAIKRNAFIKLGGFDINYAFPNVEDNELGIRLKDAGYNIILDKTLQVEHLKKYTFSSLLKTHYLRSKGLIKLFNRKKMLGGPKNNPSSVPNSYFFNIPLTIALMSLLLSFLSRGYLTLKVTIALLIFSLFIPVNYQWLHFLNKRRGFFFTLKSLFYLPVESMVVVSGLIIGEIEYLMGRRY